MDWLLGLIRFVFVLEIPFSFMLIFVLYGERVQPIYHRLAYSMITFFTVVFLLTETLSLFSAINVPMIMIAWTLIVVILFLVSRKRGLLSLKWKPRVDFLHCIGCEKVLLLSSGVVLLLTLFMSLFTVTNNGDSMIYHLPRVLHWLQDGSVNYYYVQDSRQIFSPMLSEYTLLHIFALLGSDIFFNLLQWFAYAIAAIFLYAIFLQLDISRQARLVGVLLFLTMPMAIAQSMTTQVDLLGTMWVVIFVYLMIDLEKKEVLSFGGTSVFEMCMAAGCVGLAYITKTNACIPMALICLWFLICKLKKREKVVNLFGFVMIAAVVAACMVLPGLVRNYMYQGTFFSSEFSEKVLIQTMNPRYIFVNIYKNVSMELMQYLLVDADSNILRFGEMLAGRLRININDPLIGYGDNDYFSTGTASYYYFHHDHASNPLVMTMAILSLIYLLIVAIKSKGKDVSNKVMGLSVAVSFGFLVLTAVIRWQPWVTRLLLPSQVLLIIPIVYALQIIFSKIQLKEFIVGLIMMAVFITSINPIMFNIRVPMKNLFTAENRTELYFYYHEEEYEGYKAVIDEISTQGYHNIGLGTLHFEYVLWKELRERGCTLEHIPIEDGEEYAFSPDCIVVFNQYEDGDIITFNEAEYRYSVLHQSDKMSYGLFVKEE